MQLLSMQSITEDQAIENYVAYMKRANPKRSNMIFDSKSMKWRNKLPKEKHTKKKSPERSKMEISFNRIRPQILNRDGNKCTECGSEKRLNVHHIVKRSEGGDNSRDNLVTLCYKCHTNKHIHDGVYSLMASLV